MFNHEEWCIDWWNATSISTRKTSGRRWRPICSGAGRGVASVCGDRFRRACGLSPHRSCWCPVARHAGNGGRRSRPGGQLTFVGGRCHRSDRCDRSPFRSRAAAGWRAGLPERRPARRPRSPARCRSLRGGDPRRRAAQRPIHGRVRGDRSRRQCKQWPDRIHHAPCGQRTHHGNVISTASCHSPNTDGSDSDDSVSDADKCADADKCNAVSDRESDNSRFGSCCARSTTNIDDCPGVYCPGCGDNYGATCNESAILIGTDHPAGANDARDHEHVCDPGHGRAGTRFGNDRLPSDDAATSHTHGPNADHNPPGSFGFAVDRHDRPDRQRTNTRPPRPPAANPSLVHTVHDRSPHPGQRDDPDIGCYHKHDNRDNHDNSNNNTSNNNTNRDNSVGSCDARPTFDPAIEPCETNPLADRCRPRRRVAGRGDRRLG